MAESQFLVAESTLTDRYQTTVPAPIRKALGLEKQDKISYLVTADGTVQLIRAEEGKDPVIEKFLAFLSEDAENNPENIKPVPASLVAHARELTAGMDSDLNAPLNAEDD